MSYDFQCWCKVFYKTIYNQTISAINQQTFARQHVVKNSFRNDTFFTLSLSVVIGSFLPFKTMKHIKFQVIGYQERADSNLILLRVIF